MSRIRYATNASFTSLSQTTPPTTFAPSHAGYTDFSNNFNFPPSEIGMGEFGCLQIFACVHSGSFQVSFDCTWRHATHCCRWRKLLHSMGRATGRSKSCTGFLFLFTQDARCHKIARRYIAFEQEHFREGMFL
jgi:hypothetical protein